MAERRRPLKIVKKCQFCKDKSDPSFKDIAVLRRYLSERGKILPRLRSGLCVKHQRRIAQSIKHARHLALLPFVSREV
ncbi:MAG: 30S ribosomal protein S18 [Candidatus Levybacteria bacterium]|nr:30S ribosomal protein S18 [Candidatus Levybacteria bacterium]